MGVVFVGKNVVVKGMSVVVGVLLVGMTVVEGGEVETAAQKSVN